MSKRASGAVLRAIRTIAAATERTDLELLTQFNAGDEAAFAALVERHSGMVLGVCRRALPTVQDAEDACQATFLVLARKAKGGRWQTSVANWLYTTARRVASKATRAAARRAKRETHAATPPAPSLLDQLTGREAFAALDEELDRLPPIYREPLVLCYLQGLTRDEAAARLGVPAATVKSQLDRGRKRLADALTKRGIALGAGLLAAAATSTARAVSPVLHQGILAAAGGSPSAPVAALVKEVAVDGIIKQAKWAGLAVIGATILGLGVASRSPLSAGPGEPAKVAPRVSEDTKHTLAGQVLGADGKPAVAELILLRSDDSPLPLGKSGADGRFRVTVPLGAEDAHLLARVGKEGVGYAHFSPRSGNVTLQLTKDNVVRGRVIDTQGKPVAGAVVFPHYVYDFGKQGAEPYLSYVKTSTPHRGRLAGQNNLQTGVRTAFDLPDGGSVLAAKSGKDGRFELAGLGAERVAGLYCRAPGLADAEVLVVNRANFDPAPFNQAAADARERMLPKNLRRPKEQPLCGPEVTIVLEGEKVIRGVVKDRDTGRPRPGVEVTFGRVSGFEILSVYHTATTGKDGRFEIRGSRKYSAYVPEVKADPQTGYLPAQVEVKDTAGYEPIDVEIACAKGIVVTGKLTDKGTGRPLAGVVHAEPMQDNTFLKKFPSMEKGLHGLNQMAITREDGSFRLVTLPGPVLVMAGLRVAQYEIRYKPVEADPNYPQYFNRRYGSLGYNTANGGRSLVRGCWCKVIDLKGTENGATLNIELEPVARKTVRVVGPDGTPVAGCNATGVADRDMYPIHQDEDTVSVYGLAPRQQRFIVVGHQTQRLVGAAVVKEDDKDPVVKLGAGGSVTGRVVGADSKPVAGMAVTLRFDHSSVAGVFELLHMRRQVVTAADGTFRIDTVIPGHGFRLVFSKGPKYYGPHPSKAPQHKVENHGDALKLGDVKAEPRENPAEG